MKDKMRDFGIAIADDVTPEQGEKIRIIKEHDDALSVCKEDLETQSRIPRTGQDDSNRS